jgi:hypothetical protein
MASNDPTRGPGATNPAARGAGVVGRTARRLTTETKAFFKTSEWWAYVVIVVAILIAGNSIEGEEGGADIFAADKVWLYITILTVGYLISRGLAKSGVREPYTVDPGDSDRDR